MESIFQEWSQDQVMWGSWCVRVACKDELVDGVRMGAEAQCCHMACVVRLLSSSVRY